MKNIFSLSSLGLLVATSWGCAHGTIEGTQIEATEDNKQVYRIIEDVRAALEAKNADEILKHVSVNYFEDNGTATQTDDYGYNELKSRVLPESLATAKELHVAITVQDIKVVGDKAIADVRYSSRAQLDLPSGTLWDSHRDFNRLTLAKEDGVWKITSGL